MVAKIQSWKTGSKSCLTMEAEPWKVQSVVPHAIHHTNTKASATASARIPVVDPQPYSPCSLTFKAQNSVTDVTETALVDPSMGRVS